MKSVNYVSAALLLLLTSVLAACTAPDPTITDLTPLSSSPRSTVSTPGLGGATSDGESGRSAIDNQQWSEAVQNPDSYIGAAVDLTGNVFYILGIYGGALHFQMYTDPERRQGNTHVAISDTSQVLREGYIVRIVGVFREIKTTTSQAGTELKIPWVEATGAELIWPIPTPTAGSDLPVESTPALTDRPAVSTTVEPTSPSIVEPTSPIETMTPTLEVSPTPSLWPEAAVVPTDTPTPIPMPTNSPLPAVSPTNTSLPSSTPTETPWTPAPTTSATPIPPTTATSTAAPTDIATTTPTNRPAAPTSTPMPTATATSPAIPSPTVLPATPTPVPTAVPSSLAVGNTGQEGVYIRRTPAMADKIKAWPDGTKMVVVGPDQQAEGRAWKNVRDPDGNLGWVPAEYLTNSPPTAPASGSQQPPSAVPSPPVGQPPVQPSSSSGGVTVGNTGGIGAYVRRSPDMADKVKAWPDGTQLQVVGPDRQAGGMVWKNVKDPDGNVGWIPSQYVRP